MPDPESAKQHIRKRNLQCYQYKHCTHCFTQVYANSHIHLREDQKYGRWTCALVVEWATVFRWAYETCKAKTQNPVYNEEKPPPLPPPPETSRPQQFSAIVAKYTLQDGVESDDEATKEINPTPIMKVTVVIVTMKCTPDHPQHWALNSLHDIAYYKWIVVNCSIKCITFCSIGICYSISLNYIRP